MSDWLTKLKELEYCELPPGKWRTRVFDIQGDQWSEIFDVNGELVAELRRNSPRTSELICHVLNKSKEIEALVQAVKECREKFMAVDDGFFKGLIPPEFGSVSVALNNLLKE